MNIYEKEKKILKSTRKSDVDAVLAECSDEDKDQLIIMLVMRMNGGLIHE